MKFIFHIIILSIFVEPLLQEYFDPLVFLMVFTFFNSKLFINYKNSIILFLYFSILLIISNVYYYKLLNYLADQNESISKLIEPLQS